MARHIVKVDSLISLLDHWISQISAVCGSPVKRIEFGTVILQWPKLYEGQPAPVDNEVDQDEEKSIELEEGHETIEDSSKLPILFYRNGLFESLEGLTWERIKWFYHCDDARGNTIRLYDQEHFLTANNADFYYQRQNTSGYLGVREDRVIIRTEHIGTTKQELKKDLFKVFGRENQGWWGGNKAPTDERHSKPSCKIERLCEQVLDRRLAYFQNPNRNNMPGYRPLMSCDIDLCFPIPTPPLNPTPREYKDYTDLLSEITKRRNSFRKCKSDGAI